jgi:SEC-C motif/Tetratricopeptide repeat
MAIGRNAPCPCGSGNKYKKCCLPAHERDAATRHAPTPPPAAGPAWHVQDDGLDDLSNSVIHLVKARRFDDALGACRRLLAEFPDVVDGLERSAMVHAALGDHATAADFYRKALAFVTHPSRCHEYEGTDFYQQQIDLEEKLAGLR